MLKCCCMRFSVLLLKTATLMDETHLLVSQQAHYTVLVLKNGEPKETMSTVRKY